MKTRKRSSSSSAAAAAAAKSKAGGIQVSPISIAADTPIITGISPKKFDFNLTGFKTTSSSKKKTLVATSTLVSPINRSPTLRTPSTISDLKDHVSSRSDSIKRNLDLSHSEILKEFEAYHSRLSKRFKIHTQTCQQVMDEAEKEHKKMSDRISESVEAMKGSYAEFIKESQNSAARVCKSAIPELMQSMEKSVESLRKRYGIPATTK